MNNLPCASHPPDAQAGPLRTIAFFAHDATESTVIKRATAFQANGSHVIGFMFRRSRGIAARAPTWENVELGTTVNRNYLSRIPKLFAGTIKVLMHRHLFRRCQVYYARNIDMLLVALMVRRLIGSGSAVVYEVLDVQRIFLGERLINRLFRWAERTMLASCDLLVVSSPDFISHYFQPYQKFAGHWRLLENKVFMGQLPSSALERSRQRPAGPPWVIGWFGTLRCVRSLEILCRIADRLGDRVEVHIRGRPSTEDLPMHVIESACAHHANVSYAGSYSSPHDLAAIYGMVHFAWCIDYLDAGVNSDWLLPNRLYEGGLMGALALARKDTSTGRMVEQHALGWALAEPLETTVEDLLAALDALTYERMWSAVDEMSRSMFIDLTDTRDLLEWLDQRQGTCASS